MVMESLGLASDDYSFPYVTGWSEGDTKVVIAAADAAKKCAVRILDRLEAVRVNLFETVSSSI
jgi:hypothetical protein